MANGKMDLGVLVFPRRDLATLVFVPVERECVFWWSSEVLL